MPYQYLVDPSVRKCVWRWEGRWYLMADRSLFTAARPRFPRSTALAGFDWPNTVVIVDEAHNLTDVAADAGALRAWGGGAAGRPHALALPQPRSTSRRATYPAASRSSRLPSPRFQRCAQYGGIIPEPRRLHSACASLHLSQTPATSVHPSSTAAAAAATAAAELAAAVGFDPSVSVVCSRRRGTFRPLPPYPPPPRAQLANTLRSRLLDLERLIDGLPMEPAPLPPGVSAQERAVAIARTKYSQARVGRSRRPAPLLVTTRPLRPSVTPPAAAQERWRLCARRGRRLHLRTPQGHWDHGCRCGDAGHGADRHRRRVSCSGDPRACHSLPPPLSSPCLRLCCSVKRRGLPRRGASAAALRSRASRRSSSASSAARTTRSACGSTFACSCIRRRCGDAEDRWPELCHAHPSRNHHVGGAATAPPSRPCGGLRLAEASAAAPGAHAESLVLLCVGRDAGAHCDGREIDHPRVGDALADGALCV